MGLETTTVITGLNETYPTTADAIQQGDDHIRLIKAVLKNCFPNVNAPLTASMIPNVPAGGIAATTLQAAIDELGSEKANKDGTGATGTWGISISGNAATATNATNATNSTNATNASNAAAISDGAVSTSAKLANNIVTNAKLARAGTAGQLLTSQGTVADPIWANPPAGGVSSFNGRGGAVSLSYGDVTGALGYAPSAVPSTALVDASVIASGSYYSVTFTRANGGTFTINTGQYNPGICLHPHSIVQTGNGKKFLCDVRPGDLVQVAEGFAEVLGVWESALGPRAMVCLNEKAVFTPGHLIPLQGGDWATVDVAEYLEHDAGLVCPVKTLDGMQKIVSKYVPDVEQLTVGMVLANGEVVTSIEHFEFNQHALPVYSLILRDADSFVADGLLVATLD